MSLDSAEARTRPWRRAQTPTVLQMEAVECGAAALAIILGYYGRHVPLEELRVACGVSRDGSTAKNILRAARHYGLEAKGFQLGLDTLRNEQCPVMVFWNFNHFLVVEGFRGGWVYLNDPASGRRKITLSEFGESYTGVALKLRPGPDFRRGGKPPGLLASLFGRLKGGRGGVALVVLFSLMLVIPGIIVPGASKIFIDNYLVRGSQEFVRPLLLVVAATTIVQAVLVWLQQRTLLRLETKLALAGSAKFIWHVLRLPAVFFTQRHTGDIATRVSANDRIAVLLSGDLGTSMVNTLTIVFYGVAMATFDPILTFVGVAMAAINLVCFSLVNRKRADLGHKLREEQTKAVSTAVAGIRTIESIKAAGREDSFFARWAGYQARSINSQQRIDLLSNLLAVLPPFLAVANIAVILGFGSLRVVDGAMTIGTLVAFLAITQSFNAPIQQLMGVGNRLTEIKADLARTRDVHDYQEDPRLLGQCQNPEDFKPKLAGRVELRDVSFGYNPLDQPFILDFNLTIKPGERIALVGGSGSGKSTVAKIVTGLFAPWSGQVLLDGMEARSIPRGVVSNSLASVDQEIFLFQGTVRDNLTMWDRSAPDDWIIQATKDAMIHEDIASRPGGYDAMLTEGGMNLSGGQRQRLEIARALTLRPSILILDEATSALDTVVEETIDRNLRRRGCTCLIVAHRLSTIRDCDEIIVMEKGRILDRGTHDWLIQNSPAYQRLIET